jgi:hypothetical protein
MPNVPDSCPSPLKPSINNVQECLDQQRQAFEHLLTHVRQVIAERSNFVLRDALKECSRQRRELDSAFELFKRAEAKVQIIVEGFGGWR